MAIQTDLSRRTALCDWLTANGIDPHDVPVDGDLTIADTDQGRVIHCEVIDRAPDGRVHLNARTDGPALKRITVPLQTEPPAWFEPYEKPTREQLLAVVERLRAMHRPRTERHGSGCVQCGIVWPCPTVRTLDGEQP